MTAREKRLERRLCDRERELIDVQRQCAWYFERWMIANRLVTGLASLVAEAHRLECEVRRLARAA